MQLGREIEKFIGRLMGHTADSHPVSIAGKRVLSSDVAIKVDRFGQGTDDNYSQCSTTEVCSAFLDTHSSQSSFRSLSSLSVHEAVLVHWPSPGIVVLLR